MSKQTAGNLHRADDPYHRYLGISPDSQPPNHYRLLGVDLLEADLDVIEASADRQITYLRQQPFQRDPETLQSLFDEVSDVRVCLLNPETKAEYDEQLRTDLASGRAKQNWTMAGYPLVEKPVKAGKTDEEPKFDAHHRWLGISPANQPPDHYRLLGLDKFESNAEVIQAAADRQMTFVRQRATGPHRDASQKLLNELANVRLCLIKIESRAIYDAQLRGEQITPVLDNADSPDLVPPAVGSSGSAAFPQTQTQTSSPAPTPPAIPPAAVQPVSLKSVAPQLDTNNPDLPQPAGTQIPTVATSETETTKTVTPPVLPAKSTTVPIAEMSPVAGPEYPPDLPDLDTQTQFYEPPASRRHRDETVTDDNEPRQSETAIEQKVQSQDTEHEKVTVKSNDEFERARFWSSKKLAVASAAGVIGLLGSIALITLIAKSGSQDDRTDQRPSPSMVTAKIDESFVDAMTKEKLEIRIDGKSVQLKNLQQGLRLAPGEHKLDILRAKRAVYTREFLVAEGKNSTLVIAYEGNQVSGKVEVPLSTAPLKLPSGKTGEALVLKGGERLVFNRLAFAPSGRYLVSGSTDAVLRVWDLETRKEIHRLRPGGSIYALAVSPDGETVLTNGPGTTLQLLHLKDGEKVQEFSGHTAAVSSAGFSPDGSLVISCGGQNDGTVRLWDVEDGKEKWNYKLHGGSAELVKFSKDGKKILAVVDQITMLLDAASGQRLRVFDGVSPATLLDDGRALIAKGSGTTPVLWTTSDGAQSRALSAPANIATLALSRDERHAASTIAGSRQPSIKVWNLATGEDVAQFDGHKSAVYALAFSPDGGFVASASADSTIRLWRVPDSVAADAGSRTAVENPQTSNIKREVRRISWGGLSPVVAADGRRVAAIQNGYAKVWDGETGALLFKSPSLGSLGRFSLSLDGRYIVTAGTTTLHLWDVDSGQELNRFSLPGAAVLSLSVSPDNQRLLATLQLYKGGSESAVMSIELVTGRELQRFQAEEPGRIQSAAFSPDGKFVAAVEDTTINLFDAQSGKLEANLTGHEPSPRGGPAIIAPLSYSTDGRQLVSAGADGTIRVWDIEGGTEVRRIEEKGATAVSLSGSGQQILAVAAGLKFFDAQTGDEPISFEETSKTRSVAIVPGSSRVVMSDSDGTLRFWEMPELTDAASINLAGQNARLDFKSDALGQVSRFQAHAQSIAQTLFSPDGSQVVSFSTQDPIIRIWDPVTGEALNEFQTGETGVTRIAYSPGGDVIFCGHSSGKIVEWIAVSGKTSFWPQPHTGPITSLAVSSDGKSLVTTGGDLREKNASVRMWDIRTAKEQWSYQLHKQTATSAEFSVDGKLVLAEVDGIVTVLNAENGERIRMLDGSGLASLSPDGRFALASDSGAIRLWELNTGQEVQRLEGYNPQLLPSALAFSPDGRLAATAEQKIPCIRLWDIALGKQLVQLPGAKATNVTALAFSSDGKSIVFGQQDGSIHHWQLPSSATELDDAVEIPTVDAATSLPAGDVGEVRRAQLPGVSAIAAAISGDGKHLAMIHGSHAKMWDLAGKVLEFKTPPLYRPAALAVSRDGRTLVTRTSTEVSRWNTATGELLNSLPLAASRMTLAPDGRQLVVLLLPKVKGSIHQTLLFDLDSGEEVANLDDSTFGPIAEAAYSPDGKLLAVAHEEVIRILDAETRSSLHNLFGHKAVKSKSYLTPQVVFSDDGSELYSAGRDMTLRVWDVETGEPLRTMSAPRVTALTLSYDGRCLAPTNKGLTLYQLIPEEPAHPPKPGSKPSAQNDPPTAREVAVLGQPGSTIQEIAFVPGGKHAVTTGSDGAIRVWRLPDVATDVSE